MNDEPTETPGYMSVRKLIVMSFVFFIVPFLGFIAIKLQFDPNTLYKSESLHTLGTLVISALALLVAFLGYTAYVDTKDIRIMFIIFAFFTFGSVFAIHALSLPSLEIASQKFFGITEHYSLFFVSLLVFVGAFLSGPTSDSVTYNKRFYFIVFIQILILLFFFITFISPGLTAILDQTISIPIILTGILFLMALAKLVQQYAIDHNKFIINIILGISVILNNAIIPFFSNEWSAGWWYFHFILILSFIAASFGIMIDQLKGLRTERIN